MTKQRPRKRRAKVGTYKTVFRGKLYTIKQARVLPTSGKPLTYELAEHQASAYVIALDGRGRVLVNHEYRSRQRRFDWKLPGGRVERGESPRRAAQRELREETGYRAKHLKPFLTFGGTRSQSLHWPTYVFTATGLQHDPLKRDADEDIDTHWLPLRQAARMALTGAISGELAAGSVIRLAFRRGLLRLR